MDIIFGTKKCKYLLMIFVICCSLFLTNCDPYADQKPHANTRWICEDPYIVIEMQEDGSQITTMGKGETSWEFFLGFRSGRGVDAYYEGTVFSEDTLLFRGRCVFEEETIVIKIKEDNYWDYTYSELVFHLVK